MLSFQLSWQTEPGQTLLPVILFWGARFHWAPDRRAQDPIGPPCVCLLRACSPKHYAALPLAVAQSVGLKPAPSKATGDQRGSLGRPGPSLIYFSINKRCICWVARERAADARSLSSAAICPLAGLWSGGGEPGPFLFFLQRLLCNQAACFSASLFPINPTHCGAAELWRLRTHLDLLKQRHLLRFHPLRMEQKVCVCVSSEFIKRIHSDKRGMRRGV